MELSVKTMRSEARLAQVRNYFTGFWGTWLLHLGQQLGLFAALAEAPATSAALAERLGYEPDYTDVWCRAAHAYEFLEGSPEEGWRLAEGLAEVLEPLGAWAATYVRVSYRVNETLEAVFRGTALPEPSLSLRLLLADGLRASYRGLLDRLIPQVPELEARLRQGGRVVEFGCGTGYGLELLKERYPHLELTGIESDYECAREAERATRAVIVVGTAEESRYESRFDAAIFHRSLEESEDPRRALARAAAALKPGGFLIVSSPELGAEGFEAPRSEEGRLRLGERFFFGMFLAGSRGPRPLPLNLEAWAEEEGLDLEAAVDTDDGRALIFRKRPGGRRRGRR